MANSYESFYLHDLLSIIDKVAMDIQIEPVFAEKKQDGTVATMADVSNHNSLIAMHNEGVREMARQMKAFLTEVNETDD